MRYASIASTSGPRDSSKSWRSSVMSPNGPATPTLSSSRTLASLPNGSPVASTDPSTTRTIEAVARRTPAFRAAAHPVEGSNATSSTSPGQLDGSGSPDIVSTTTCCWSAPPKRRNDSTPRRTSSGHPSASHWIENPLVRCVAGGTSAAAMRRSGAVLRGPTREPSRVSVTVKPSDSIRERTASAPAKSRLRRSSSRARTSAATSSGTEGRSDVGGLRRLAETSRERLQRLERDRRMLHQETAEDPLRETEQLHRRRRRHGRGARPAVEEGDLPEEVARTEHRLLLAADRDLRLAVEDQEEADPAVSLPREDGVLLVVHVLGGLRDQADLAFRTPREEGHLRK